MRWPLRLYEFDYKPFVYRVSESQLLARDDGRSGPGRYLYRSGPYGVYFVIDLSTEPPVVRIGPGLNPYETYDELGVKYLPRRLAVPPGSWGHEWGDRVDVIPLVQAEGFPLPRRGLDPRTFPQPAPPALTENGLEAVIGGLRYRVRGARLLAQAPGRRLYKTPAGRYFATSWASGWPFIEALSPLAARVAYYNLDPVVAYWEAFPETVGWETGPDDGWRVPALVPVKPLVGQQLCLPDFVAFGRAWQAREGRLLAWGTSWLGSGELVLEALIELGPGEVAEVIWGGGGDHRVLEWPPGLARYPYERLPYKAVPPEEALGAPVEEA